MHDDDLTKILRRAEAELPRSTIAPAELAGRVHRAHRKQQQRQRALLAAVPVVAIAAFLGWRLTPGPQRSPIGAPSRQVVTVSEAEPIVTASEADIARLEAEAEAHTKAARAMLAARTRPSLLLSDDPLAGVNEHVNIVAYRMILEADSKQSQANGTQMQLTAESAEIYQRVLELFPTSHSAELARQRLSQSTSSQGESS